MSTIKQKMAMENMLENGGNMGQAMIDAGYSGNTAKTPQKLTESGGWKELMEIHLPNSLLVEKHRELLTVPKITTTRIKGAIIDTEESLDVQALKAGLDMAYKLKGAYAPEKTISLNVNAEITNPKARELAEKYEDELKKNI